MLELLMNEAQVLRKEGCKIKEIAARLNKSERTIYNYLSEEPRPRKEREYKSVLDPFKPLIDAELDNNPHLNKVLLFERLQRQGYTGSISLLREYAAEVEKTAEKHAVIRFEMMPGKQAQVDWKELGKQDTDCGYRKIYVFKMLLGNSRKPFIMHTYDMKQSTLHYCHEKAFEYFGGVPEEILYDNMKTAFICDSDGVWKPNKALLSFANHYGFTPKRCQVRRPQTKGKVGRGIQFYEGNFWAGIDKSKLNLDYLNEEVLKWIEKISQIKIRDLGESRAERFEKEKPFLRKFPASKYNNYESILVKVNRESYIRYQNELYSVPPKFIGHEIELRSYPFSKGVVLYHQGKEVRSTALYERGLNGRMVVESDLGEIKQSWENQFKKKPKTPVNKADTIVNINSPEVYDRLIANCGAAVCVLVQREMDKQGC
jgi:transposase